MTTMTTNPTKMHKFTVENKFTGYRRVIFTYSEVPALATIKQHIRASKAEGCTSHTIIRNEDGDRLEVVDMGRGEEVVFSI